jgi:2-dehydropantoate 2-reductase
MNKIGIFGIGSIGSILVKYLDRNIDNKIYYYNRTQHKSISISYNKTTQEIPIEFYDKKNIKLDWLIVCIKKYQIEEAIQDIKELITFNTKLVIFQNGIELSAPYEKLISKSRILETTIDCTVLRINKSEFNQLRIPVITLPKKDLAKDFVNLFINDEIKIDLLENFIKAQWIKLIESSSIGAIQSLTGQPCSIFKEHKYLNDYRSLIKEGITVANSDSINIEIEILSQIIDKMHSYPPSKGSSMLSDKLKGNTLELDAKIGAIVKIADRNNIKVPVTKKYYKSLLNQNK